jgi:hypothetical protein
MSYSPWHCSIATASSFRGSGQSRSLALTKSTLADLEKSGLSFGAHVWVKAGAYTIRVVLCASRGAGRWQR